MNTHLKGRVVKAAGTNYLVLQEDAGSADWVRLKALDRRRTVHWVRCVDLMRGLVRRSALEPERV